MVEEAPASRAPRLFLQEKNWADTTESMREIAKRYAPATILMERIYIISAVSYKRLALLISFSRESEDN